MGTITGTAGSDVLIGSDMEADIIDGLAGADIIDGGMEDDEASGDEGNDTISGSFQDDGLVGMISPSSCSLRGGSCPWLRPLWSDLEVNAAEPCLPGSRSPR